MELATMRSRLQTSHFNHYQTVLEFVDDFKLMIRNCHIFNRVGVRPHMWKFTFGVLAEMHIFLGLLYFRQMINQMGDWATDV